jgi:uncharacterized membrane protein
MFSSRKIATTATAAHSGIADSLVLNVNLLGLTIELGTLVKALEAVLLPIFGMLDDILAPVLSLLGVQVGLADVSVFQLSCGAPQLVR